MAGEELIDRHVRVMARLQATVTGAVAEMWRRVPDLSDQALERWLASVVPVVVGAEQVAATQTAAYLAALLAEMTGQLSAPVAVDGALVTGPAVRNGVPPQDVYRRPMIEARSLVAGGVGRGEAFRRAQTRATQLAATDVQRARTLTAQQALAGEERVVGYRRVLTGRDTCGLCVVASTQRYRRGDLLPIHPGCDCGIAPIVGTEDPGRVINAPLLEQTHETIEERFGPQEDRSARADAYRTMLEVYDHGEYGPTLAVAGQHQMDAVEALARDGS